MTYRLKHRIEYGLFRVATFLVRVLPYRVALAMGWGVAWLGHYVFGFRQQEARSRLREVLGPDKSDREIHHLAWLSFRNLCFNIVEIISIPRLNRRWFEAHSNIQVGNELLTQIQQHHGGVLAIPHIGNWDIAGIGSKMVGVPVFFIAGRQKNPLVDAYLNKMRGATGIQVVLNDQKLLKNVIRNLKAGQVMAILPDVRAKTDSLSISFFGKQANIGAGMALFARQAGVPIFPVIARRIGWSQHQWQLLDPVFPDPRLDKQADWLRMTQAVMTSFEQAIRQTPDQYFWYNKRWVLDPLDHPEEPTALPDLTISQP